MAVTALAPFHCHRERTGRSKGLCLTVVSDPFGGSGKHRHPADPAPPLLASAKFRGHRAQQEWGMGEQLYQVALDSHLGRELRGTPGFKIKDLAENSCFLLNT